MSSPCRASALRGLDRRPTLECVSIRRGDGAKFRVRVLPHAGELAHRSALTLRRDHVRENAPGQLHGNERVGAGLPISRARATEQDAPIIGSQAAADPLELAIDAYIYGKDPSSDVHVRLL
jgi:hypothetical protein